MKAGERDDRASSKCRSRTTSRARTCKITGTIKDGYKVVNGELVFDRTLHGLRNTVLLPAGWELSAVLAVGHDRHVSGRAFVAFINLNSENEYKVTVRARKATAQ